MIGPPVVMDTNQIMYRKDVLQKYGVTVPMTLDELEAAAKALNGKPMTDDGQPGFGFITRGKRAAATSIFAGFLHAMGGTWLTANREPSFDSDDGVKAFDLFGRLLRLYGPPGSENNHWYETSSIMSQGKAAIYIEIDSISAFVEDSEKSKVKGKMGYAMFPKGPNGRPGTMTLAWGLGIPRNSKNPKAAWLFLQWATNRDQVPALQSERGVQGGRDSVWKDPKARAKMNPELAEALLQGLRVGNPNWNPPIVAVSEVRDSIGAAIVTSIQGGDVRAAANKAAAETKRIMAETEKK